MRVYQELATAVAARTNCINSNNTEWRDHWEDRIIKIVKDRMPSGSGVDCGTEFDLEESNDKKLVLHCSFHHMNDGGYYDGWTGHTITVTPGWSGPDIKISGRNRNDIKDYLGDLFHEALNAEYAPEKARNDG